MPTDFSLRTYFETASGEWTYDEYEQLPVTRPCLVVFHVNHEEAGEDANELLGATRKLLEEIQATYVSQGTGDWHELGHLEANRLHVVVCKGSARATLDEDISAAADRSDNRTWILPVLKRNDANNVATVLSSALAKRNVAFWDESISELSLTVLARAGVTMLDRRAFISYRRTDTSPIADQLFDALKWRNFQLFLDRVSVDPGVDFQAELFAQLSYKSLVVLLNSRNFPNSRWTMDEIRFARERRLSLVILRLPDATDSLGATASEEILLKNEDLVEIEAPGSSSRQFKLQPLALDRLIKKLIFQHDKELIGRARDVRLRVLEAAELFRASSSPATGVALACIPSKHDSTVTVEIGPSSNPKRYAIYPSVYPPDVSELYDAASSTRTLAQKRLVVGHTAGMLPHRANQLDWVVNGRNVGYHDIDAISVLFDLMAAGTI